MIVIPWYVRMAIDTTICLGPFLFVASHPLLFFGPAERKNRLFRKRTFEDYPLPEGRSPHMGPEEVRALYQRLGFQEHY